MSSFSDKLAIFQKNVNKTNISNKKNEKINNNKIYENNYISNFDEKRKNKENGEIKIQKVFTRKIKNINENKINNINSNQNIVKNNLSFFENKEKNNNIIKKNINNININLNNNKEVNQQINSEEKKDKDIIKEKINKSNKINNLKNHLNIFESKEKINEIKNSTKKDKGEIKKINSIEIITRHKPVHIKNTKLKNAKILNNTKKPEDKKDTKEYGINNKNKIISINEIDKINKISINNNNIYNNNIYNNATENIIKTEPNESSSLSKNSKIKEEIFLQKKLIPDSEINDTFCIGFFIASFNLKHHKIIENSNKLISDCGHEFCSSLPAIIPEIISRYPEKDNKDFEISDLTASICFPNGIKICFDKNEIHVNGLNNYSSMLTNQLGKRYYLSTYHLYFKYPYDDFMKEMKKSDYGNYLDITLLNSIRIKYIYLPFCICLLSKYPFFNQMEKCLESLRFTLANNKSNPKEIYDLLLYLIKSIPVPPVGTQLYFPLPYYSDFIIINQPIYKDYILFGDNPLILLEYLNVDEIIIIMRLLLFEQKILLIGNNYDIITQIIFNFYRILYPFQFVHTLIPIMTNKIIKYLDSFLPFFNGMHISLYQFVLNSLENIEENIFIFDINKHTFQINTNLNLNSKNVIKKINDLVPQFPKNILNNMNYELNVIKAYLGKTKDNNKKNSMNNPEEINKNNIKIKQIFMQAFIEILSGYKTYLSLVNEKPIFNTKAILENKPKADLRFYKELTETQLFQVFIQNNPANKKANTFIEELFEAYDNLSDKKCFSEVFRIVYSITSEINEKYFINLDILENFDKNNIKEKKIKENLNQDKLKKILRKKYSKYDIYFKPKSILKVNKIIITEKIYFDFNKINKNIFYYIIPNSKLNFEIIKRKKTIKRKSQMFNRLNSLEEKLSPEEKDEIRENISDIICIIFKNDKIEDPKESQKILLDSLYNEYGIKLYVNSLYKNKGILYKESFDFLENLIFSSINKIINLDITIEKKLYYLVRLILSCDYYYTKKGKFISDILYPKLSKIKMINDFKFWKEYAEEYIKNIQDNYITKEDKWIECLRKIEKIMTIMGLDKTTIYSIIAELCKINVSEKKFSDFMKEITCKLKIYNY